MSLATTNPSNAMTGVKLVRAKHDLREALIWPRRTASPGETTG